MRQKGLHITLILNLYVPWIASTLFGNNPVISYWIAWLGSFYIFYHTWVSSKRFILPDLPVHKQIMRPIFLQQLIFAGFMCCTSAFYFLDKMGYMYLEKIEDVNLSISNQTLVLVAHCQRLCLLAHASFVLGILLFQSKHLTNKPLYKIETTDGKKNWMISVCLITFFLSLGMEVVPGLYQFSIGLYNVSIFIGALILVKGIHEQKLNYLIFGGGIFMANFIKATLSGYKEHILVNLIILTCLLYPYYRKTVITISIPAFVILFYVLPTYAAVMRSESWFGNSNAEDARSAAVDAILTTDSQTLKENNWTFLTNRLSEVDMFKDFVRSTPNEIPFYGFDILTNAVTVLIPRAIWPDKPITELVAMERVYNAGVIEVGAEVSAKTRPVVDGYLSAGTGGVFVYMLLLGAISQALCNKCENLFAGYEIGCVIFYNGFFQILWRGETTEFMMNSVFWSLIMMLIVFRLLKMAHILKKA